MKLRLQLEGGFGHFPGLAAPRELDTAQLPAHDAQAVRDCVEQAQFFERPSGDPRTLPDARQYTLEVHAGARSRALTFSDPVGDEHLEQLVNLVRRLAG